jgi:signal transduction histidine kinase
MSTSSIHAAAEFSHEFTAGDDVSRLMQRLVDEIERAGVAPAAVAYELLETGRLRLAGARGVTSPPIDGPAESIGDELQRSLLASAPAYEHATSLPLVTEKGLYGVVVLLFDRPSSLKPEHRALLKVLADLAAAAISRAREHDRLERAYLELKASREVLAKTEKLRLLGQMAAGLSHDLRNIFSGALMVLQLVRRDSPSERMHELSMRIDGTLRRGMELLERLKNFSRPVAESTKIVDLNQVAREAADLGVHKKAKNIAFDVLLGTPPPVRVESGELLSALINLIQNACDALGDQGQVRLETGGDGEQAWISVVDDGPGVPAEIRERIFEPFFTTKGEAGTGLGLAMIDAFVRRNGGSIDLESADGRGTRFTLSFPAARE